MNNKSKIAFLIFLLWTCEIQAQEGRIVTTLGYSVPFFSFNNEYYSSRVSHQPLESFRSTAGIAYIFPKNFAIGLKFRYSANRFSQLREDPVFPKFADIKLSYVELLPCLQYRLLNKPRISAAVIAAYGINFLREKLQTNFYTNGTTETWTGFTRYEDSNGRIIFSPEIALNCRYAFYKNIAIGLEPSYTFYHYRKLAAADGRIKSAIAVELQIAYSF
jgi:hypothetical protein